MVMENYQFPAWSDQNHMFFSNLSPNPLDSSSFSQMLSSDTSLFATRSSDLSVKKEGGASSNIIDQNPLQSSCEQIANHNYNNSQSAGPGEDVDPADEQNGKARKGERKAKKPRYAFQTRSQVDILDDGYRWRKYGQKAVKNNKFPRSYYRCTHQSCNVKKQVQRLSKDESVVVTTYEGIHTHPIEKPTDNFDSILSQMQILSSNV